MKVVQFLRNRIQTRACNRDVRDGQDLILYRQLRCSENKVYEARDCLDSILELHKKAEAEHMRIMQFRDELEQRVAAEDKDRPDKSTHELQSAISRQQDSACQLEELQKKIVFLKREMSRLETECQSVQMNVRTYFYSEPCQGSLPEAAAAVGQSAQ
jgi:chromosome segregation ATPase